MQLKRHTDFLNESNEEGEYYGYLSIDILKNLPEGTVLKQYYEMEGDSSWDGESVTTIIYNNEEGFNSVDGQLTEEEVAELNDDMSDLYAEREEDIKDTRYEENEHKDEKGFYLIDVYQGGKMYYRFEDESKNTEELKKSVVGVNKFKLHEDSNEFKDKNEGNITDINFLLKELKALVHDNDQYKANIKMEGDSIVITHEMEQKKQKLVIKDNGEPNDFFLISGIDDQGKTLDDMGQEPAETVFIQVSKYFQEL